MDIEDEISANQAEVLAQFERRKRVCTDKLSMIDETSGLHKMQFSHEFVIIF